MCRKVLCAFLLIAGLSLSVPNKSIGQNKVYSILSQNMGDSVFTGSPEIYGENALWGYMNGGADLYLEYGMKELQVFHMKIGGESYKMEVFEMPDSEAAFGIYSILKFICKDGMTEHSCFNPFQQQSIYGKYYISLLNFTGSDEAGKTSRNLIELLWKSDSPESFNIGVKYPVRNGLKEPLNAVFKQIAGPLGMQNSFPEIENLFKGFSGLKLYLKERSGVYFGFFQVDSDTQSDFFNLNPLLSVDEMKEQRINDYFISMIKKNAIYYIGISKEKHLISELKNYFILEQ